jgi:choline dehydrogenase
MLATQRGLLTNPLHEAWLDAGREAGYPITDDMNGFQQEGLGRMDMTVGGGRRCSAANAYLRPAMARSNLTVRTHSLATRILFERRRATGVRYRRGDADQVARARREVILSGGPVNSPQLLKLSGVGPAAELADHGITVVHDLPGVGENLQDHLEFYFQVASKEPVTLFTHMTPFRKALIGARWIVAKDGLGSTNHFETGGFIRSRAGVRYPDIQFHFLPMAVNYDGSSLAREHGFQAHVGPMRSKSRGWVRLASANPLDHPKIFFNYMSHPDDWLEMRACVRLTRELFGQPAFARYHAREMQPGADVQTDEQIDAFIRKHVETAYHPSCTCKMGRDDDPSAVVDSRTRVRGIESLRVVDSSIMPSITNGNLNAPTIMIAEKAADHILGKSLLPESRAPFYIAPRWEISQR